MTRTNIETVQKFLNAQYAGECDYSCQAYAQPNFQWIVSSNGNENLRTTIPWAGYSHQGKEGYARLMTLLFSEFEALEFEPSRYTDAGAHVFVEGHFTFRHRQTGKIADSDWIALFDMKSGLISGGQFYENTAGIVAARQTES